MPSQKNIAIREEIEEKIEKAKVIFVTDYKGLKVNEITELRKALRKNNVDLKVYKNRLFKIALQNKNIEGLDEYLKGPSAFVIGYDEPVTPAKVLAEFAKKNENLKFKGGWFEGNVIDADGIKALSRIPPKEEMYASMLGSLLSPLTGLVGILNGLISGLVYTISEIAKQKEA